MKGTVKNQRSLFDHLKEVTEIQSHGYWESLTDEDKKTFNPFMLNRFLSMNMDWVDIINSFQMYTVGSMEPKDIYMLYSTILPKKKVWLKYVKGKGEAKFNGNLIDRIKFHFNVSSSDAIDYLNIYYLTDNGLDEVARILSLYGIEAKEIKRIMKTTRG